MSVGHLEVRLVETKVVVKVAPLVDETVGN